MRRLMLKARIWYLRMSLDMLDPQQDRIEADRVDLAVQLMRARSDLRDMEDGRP
jgi:hypothetical protein